MQNTFKTGSGVVRKRGVLRVLFACLCALDALACNATFSPPIHPLTYTSPGRSEAGTLSASGTVVFGGVYGAGGSLAYAPIDHLQIETAGDFVNKELGTASLTLRVAPWPAKRQPQNVKFLFDLEAGGGGGVGGELYGNDYQECKNDYQSHCDHRKWYERKAYGGYTGIGLGVGYTFHFNNIYVRELDLDGFLRLRYELGKATNIPRTHWFEPVGGIQLRFNRLVRFGVICGGIWYSNSRDQIGLSYSGTQITFGFDFDLMPPKKSEGPGE